MSIDSMFWFRSMMVSCRSRPASYGSYRDRVIVCNRVITRAHDTLIRDLSGLMGSTLFRSLLFLDLTGFFCDANYVGMPWVACYTRLGCLCAGRSGENMSSSLHHFITSSLHHFRCTFLDSRYCILTVSRVVIFFILNEIVTFVE